MTAQPEDGRYAELTDLLRRRRHLRLVSPEGDAADVPDELAEKIGEVAEAMAQGHNVTVFSDETLISTTKAAEILGVSRQTVVRYVDSGRLRYSQPGVHRRLRLSDVLEAKQRRDALYEMMAQSHSDAVARGLDEITVDEAVAAVKQVRRERRRQARKGPEV